MIFGLQNNLFTTLPLYNSQVRYTAKKSPRIVFWFVIVRHQKILSIFLLLCLQCDLKIILVPLKQPWGIQVTRSIMNPLRSQNATARKWCAYLNRYAVIICITTLNRNTSIAAWCVFKTVEINSLVLATGGSSFKRIPDSKVHGAHLGPVGPRWAPCWPHEPWSQGFFANTHYGLHSCELPKLLLMSQNSFDD